VRLYTAQETFATLKKRFPYCFDKPESQSGYSPFLEPQLVAYGQVFQIQQLTILPFAQQHGNIISMGLRVGSAAYSTDVQHLSEEAFAALAGVKTWIVDCLRPTPSPTHSHLEQTLAWIARVKPERAILVHMSHDYDYAALAASLPAGVEAGYDGMVVECD
jgi:phosphoribosyl 1,2-cyclic phosphate phosphodiesterase